jgi:hypothetical protein
MMRFSALMLLVVITGCTAADAKAPATATTVSAKEESKSTMSIEGVVTKEGVECPAVRADDGKLYTITGKDRDKLKPGLHVKITGEIAQMSTCMQGVTIVASEIEFITASTRQ